MSLMKRKSTCSKVYFHLCLCLFSLFFLEIRNVFILLDKMHMDLANFTIKQMRPYIRQQAVTYERTKFATFLEAQQSK